MLCNHLNHTADWKLEITLGILNTSALDQGRDFRATVPQSHKNWAQKHRKQSPAADARHHGRRIGSLTARRLKPSLHSHGVCNTRDSQPARGCRPVPIEKVDNTQCICKPLPSTPVAAASVRRRRQALVLFLDASLKVREAEVIYERRDNRD